MSIKHTKIRGGCLEIDGKNTFHTNIQVVARWASVCRPANGRRFHWGVVWTECRIISRWPLLLPLYGLQLIYIVYSDRLGLGLDAQLCPSVASATHSRLLPHAILMNFNAVDQCPLPPTFVLEKQKGVKPYQAAGQARADCRRWCYRCIILRPALLVDLS